MPGPLVPGTAAGGGPCWTGWSIYVIVGVVGPLAPGGASSTPKGPTGMVIAGAADVDGDGPGEADELGPGDALGTGDAWEAGDELGSGEALGAG